MPTIWDRNTMKQLRENAPWLKLIGFTGIIVFFAAGCATYQQQNSGARGDMQKGDLTNAIVKFTKRAEKNANGKDAIIWRLELAAALRANGQYDDSNKEFALAQEKIDYYAEEAKISAGRETEAILSNQAQLPYRGRAYDDIMVNTYRALNYIAMGEPDKARPELIRAYQRQQDAVVDNEKRISKVQDAVAQNNKQEAINQVQQDGKFQAKVQAVSADLNNLRVYADYVNPFTVYLDGLYFMANAGGGSDLERARKSFERVGVFLGDNEYIKQDLAAAEGAVNGRPLTPTTYVIFETGSAPVRDQIRIDIPTFWPQLPYLGAAFPKIKFQDQYIPSLTATLNGASEFKTTLLASMDSVVGLDLKNEMPTIITKTLLSTTIKAVATHLAWEATRKRQSDGSMDNGGIAGALVIIGCVTWCAVNNIADERTWTTLPKEFQFCRFPTPLDRKVDLASADGLQRTSLTVGDGPINLIYVKSINPSTPLLVTQMKLTGSPIAQSINQVGNFSKSVEPSPAIIPAQIETPAIVAQSLPLSGNQETLGTNVVSQSDATTNTIPTNVPVAGEVEPNQNLPKNETPIPEISNKELTATNVQNQIGVSKNMNSENASTTNTPALNEIAPSVPATSETNAQSAVDVPK